MESEISKGGTQVLGNSASGPAKTQDTFAEFSDRESFNFGTAFLWFAASLSMLATVFFWWSNNNTSDLLAEKLAEKDGVVQDILSPTYKDVEKKASDFKSSVSQLKEASSKSNSKSEFIKTLYSKINNDISISSLSIPSDGSFSLAGSAQSYKSVGEQMVSLKSWNGLSNLELSSVSAEVSDGKIEKINFTLTAKTNRSSSLTASDTGTTSNPNPSEAQ